MPDVRLPDGTIIKNVPEGVTQADLQKKLELFRSIDNPFAGASTPNNPQMSDLQSFGQGFASNTANIMANTPDFLANLAAKGVNAAVSPAIRTAQGLSGAAQGQNLEGVDLTQGQPMQTPAPIQTPPLGQDFVPGPTGADILGAAQRVGEGAAAVRTGDFSQFQPDAAQQQRELTKQLMEENPTAFFLGETSSDILSLMTLRAPIAKTRAMQELRNAKPITQAGRAPLSQMGRTPLSAAGVGDDISLAPTVAEALKAASRSRPVRTISNRIGRAAETGLEGLTLSALNGKADPMETFGFAAGTQVAGSLLLGGITGIAGKSPLKNLSIAALGVGGLVQILKETTPGGKDFILESVETGFEKVILGVAAGAIAGAAGMGRVTNNFTTTLAPRVADALSALPRSATISLLTEALEDPAVESVLNKLQTDPGYFGPVAQNRLERAMFNETQSFGDTVESLMQNQDFRQKFEKIQ